MALIDGDRDEMLPPAVIDTWLHSFLEIRRLVSPLFQIFTAAPLVVLLFAPRIAVKQTKGPVGSKHLLFAVNKRNARIG